MEYVSNISKMLHEVNQFEYNKQYLDRCRNAILNVHVKDFGIKNSLKRISNDIENQVELLEKMSVVLKSSASFYRAYEENIACLECKSLEYGKENLTESGNAQKDTEHKEETSFIKIIATWKNIWKIVGNVGAVGSVASGIGTLIQNGENASVSEYISATKYFVSAVGTGASAISKGGADGIRIATGWNNAFAKIDTSSFGNAVKSSLNQQVDSLDFAKAAKLGDKVKTVTKWAGYVLTVASNGVENYNEYKSGTISSGRAWAEAGIESVVDIGIGIGSTAIVTGALAVFGVAAPATVVVGGIGTAVVVGSNAVCKWVTGGRDIGEVVADGVCNSVENMGKFFNNVKDGVKSSFTASWKGICSAFS